jgi:hypothetical protein
VDIPVTTQDQIRFTFFWPETSKWEGRDYEVAVVSNEE